MMRPSHATHSVIQNLYFFGGEPPREIAPILRPYFPEYSPFLGILAMLLIFAPTFVATISLVDPFTDHHLK